MNGDSQLVPLLSGFVVVICMTLISGVAMAQQPEEPSTDRERAQKHFERGASLFYEEKYGAAILEFQRGYAIVDAPLFPYNLALAHLKLDQLEDALRYAREAESLGGLPEDVSGQNLGRMRGIERVLSARGVAVQVSNDVAASSDAVASEEPEALSLSGEVTEESTDSDFGAWGVTGVVVAGSGAGLLTAMAFVVSDVEDDWDAYEAAGRRGDRIEFINLRKEIESGQSTGRILLYTGSALFAVGGTLLVIELFSGGESETRTSLRLMPGDGVAFGLDGVF